MITRRYSDRATPLPDQVYCDASFLIDAFVGDQPKLLGTYPSKSRARDAKSLLDWAGKQGTAFLASILCLEECTSFFLFASVRKELKDRGLPKNDWKRLRRDHPAEFKTALADGRTVVIQFYRWAKGRSLKVFSARHAAGVDDPRVAARVELYAKVCAHRFELDAMDAYHLSVARAARLAWGASSDADWKSQDRLNLFVP